MSRPSLARPHHDPYWEMDGTAVQRRRTKRRLVRAAIWLAVIAALAFIATRLPAVDPDYLIRGDGRPVLAAAMLAILAAAALLALARMRHVSRS